MLEAAMFLQLMSEPQKKQVNCLAKAIYYEARGEPELGQIAVAEVINNRTNSGRYPDTHCKVVYQDGQFPNIKSARFDFASKAWQSAVSIAVLSYTGMLDDPTNGALNFYNPKKAKKPRSFKKFLAEIGNHHFYS